MTSQIASSRLLTEERRISSKLHNYSVALRVLEGTGNNKSMKTRIAKSLQTLQQGSALSADETRALFNSLLLAAGSSDDDIDTLTDGQIGALLFGLGARLPSVSELVGAALSLREHMREVVASPGRVVIDTCGTGGSGLNAFNTSTAAAFVAAAAGLAVAKHGNRAITSKSGSADVLEALGMRLSDSPAELAEMLSSTGFAFLFAPLFHPATKRVQGIRRELGVRTIFNFLGPLVNPARPARQVLGVSSTQVAPLMAEALSELGVERAAVVSGSDGLDELTLTGESQLILVEGGSCSEFKVTPEQFGLSRVSSDAIGGFSPDDSAAKIREILSGVSSAHAELVALNSGVALWVGGVSVDLEAGVLEAKRLLGSGAALKSLELAVEFSNR